MVTDKDSESMAAGVQLATVIFLNQPGGHLEGGIVLPLS